MKAKLNTQSNIIIGSSDVIRWDDVMEINGTDIKVSKAVELGLTYGFELAFLLEKDLKSEKGLLITFPMGFLMDKLQRKVGTGEDLLKLVKP